MTNPYVSPVSIAPAAAPLGAYLGRKDTKHISNIFSSQFLGWGESIVTSSALGRLHCYSASEILGPPVRGGGDLVGLLPFDLSPHPRRPLGG